MSRSSGTGSPVYFNCSQARKGDYRNPRRFKHHAVRRTGRTRPYHSQRGSALGIRSLLEVHEYRCQCGHVGWTNHMDILRAPIGGWP